MLEKVRFLDGCLVPRTRFIPACREKVCGKYHRLYLENMHSVSQLTGSHPTSAWLCLQILDALLEKNYPLSKDKAQKVSHCKQMSSELKDIVNYIGGSITRKLKNKYNRLNASISKEQKLLCVEEMVQCEEEKGSGGSARQASSKLTTSLDRGGLAYLKPGVDDFFLLLESKVTEEITANEEAHYKLSDFDEQCSKDEIITSSFHALTYDVDTPQQTKEAVFSDVVQLYFKIRIHHECKMFLERLKSSSTMQKKSLRKSIK